MDRPVVVYEVEALEIYDPVFDFKGRYIVLYGGRSAGRSFFAVLWFYHLITTLPYFRGYFIRNVFADIKNSLYKGFKDLIQMLNVEHDFKCRDNDYTIIHIPSGNEILSKGFKRSSGQQTANIKSLTGATHAVIEEADETTESDADKFDESLRSDKVETIQLMYLLNTEHPIHWIWSRWFRGVDSEGLPQKLDDDNVLQIHGTYRDNLDYTALSTQNIYEKYKITNPKRYAVTVLGKLAKQAEGQIFTHIKPIDALPGVPDGYGLDFGYTNDPTALTAVLIINNTLYLDLLIYEPGLTNQQIAERCKDLGIARSTEIVADSAEPKSIAELNNAGLWVTPAIKGADSILAGIQVIQDMEVYLTERSKAAWEEVNFYTWKKGPDGKAINKPVDDSNHFWDSVRYYVSKVKLGKKRPSLF